jgi:hypothetical protein
MIKPRVQIVDVTPEKAAEWLKTSTGNRPLKEKAVDTYARDMQAGNWRLTHQGIAFDSEGRLRDGHHRLMALIKTGMTIPMMVTMGLGDDAMPVIDTGKIRSIGDVVSLQGVTNGARRVALARTMMTIERGLPRHFPTYSTLEVQTFLAENDEIIEWILSSMAYKTAPQSVQGAIGFCYPVDKEGVALFAKMMREGVGVPAKHPVLALNNWLRTSPTNSGTAVREAIVKTITAVYAHLHDKQITRLQVSNGAYIWMMNKRGFSSALERVVGMEDADVDEM